MRTHRAVLAVALGLAVIPAAAAFAQTTQPASTPSSAPAQASPVTKQTEPTFTVVGIWVRTNNQKEAGGNGLIPQMWQHAVAEGTLENIPNRVDHNYTVVYTNYAGYQNDDYTYVLGVRVSAADKVPDGMTTVTVPTGRYAAVESETGPLPEVIPKVWKRINSMPATELGGQRAFKADFEVYPEGFDWQSAQIMVYLGLK